MQQIAAASKHLRVIGFNRKKFITIKKNDLQPSDEDTSHS